VVCVPWIASGNWVPSEKVTSSRVHCVPSCCVRKVLPDCHAVHQFIAVTLTRACVTVITKLLLVSTVSPQLGEENCADTREVPGVSPTSTCAADMHDAF
jgi:hypothetical protein